MVITGTNVATVARVINIGALETLSVGERGSDSDPLTTVPVSRQ